MANSTALYEQIEQEMLLDKRINKFLKNSLKENKQFYQVPERKGCHAILIFNKQFPVKCNIILNEEEYNTEDKIMFFLKNKNKHDSKSHTKTYINQREPFKNSRF